MEQVILPLFLLIGLAIGVTAAWLVLRAKGQHAYDRGKADAEGERIALTERVQARDQTIAELNAKVEQLEQKVHEAQAAESNFKAKLAQYAAILDQERKQAEEKLAVVNQAQEKLADAFKALAAEALKSNNQSFLELAKATLEKFQETAKGDLEKRQQAIQELVKPVKESLEKVDTQDQRTGKGPQRGLQRLDRAGQIVDGYAEAASVRDGQPGQSPAPAPGSRPLG